MKKISKIFLIVLMSISIYLLIGKVLTPKDSFDSGADSFFRGDGFVLEDSNTIDCMIYGSSNVYSGIIPSVIYEDTNIRSYVSANPRQSIKTINFLIKKSLDKQSPKIIIIDTDPLYENSVNYKNPLLVFAAPVNYHTRWKELKLRDFSLFEKPRRSRDELKGYKFSNIKRTCTNKEYMSSNNSKNYSISKENKMSLKKINKLCLKNSIKLVLVSIPDCKNFSNKKHDEVSKYAKELKIDYFDLNYDVNKKDYLLDFKNDFRNESGEHLNVFGAIKTSKYLDNILQNNYAHLYEELKTDCDKDYEKSVDNFKKILKQNNIFLNIRK